ncbi:MAG: c-type cytochrome [Planctomycetota bacterium]|nr:c-type cytochrome [Planctomycetota bacterium]
MSATRSRTGLGLVVLLGCSWWAISSLAVGAVTAEHRKEIEEVKKDLSKVPGLISKKETEEAEKLLEASEQKLKQIAKDAGDDGPRLVGGLLKQIEQRRAGLSKRTAPAVGGGGGGGTFEKDVAPILVKQCMGCHGDDARGGLKFDTFAGIVAGCGGKLVVPGNAQASILMQKILASGDNRMPKGGKPLSADECRKITAWINAGAKFSGQNETRLSELAADGGSKKEATAPVAIATATGDEKVSFKRDIAPFMVNLCVGCHSGANPRAGFSLETFEKLMRGGRGGRVVLPGNSEDSRMWHLVGKQDPVKMPPGQALITRTNHGNLKTWIDEGAKFDGPDPKAPLRSLVPTEAELRSQALAKLSPEELVQQRTERANKLWKAAMQQDAPASESTDNVLLMGNVTPDRLKQYGEWADEAANQIAKVFRAKEQPLWRGKLTLFVFADRFSYAEFVQTNERRELLPEITSHTRIREPDDAYVCLQDLGDAPAEQTPGAKGLVLSQLTEAFLHRTGVQIPEWVSRGTGLALAARNDAKNDFYRKLAASAGTRLQSLAKPEDLLKDGTFSPADLSPVGYSVVAYMLKQGEPQYVQFVSQLLAGKSLDESLKSVYNADAAKVAAAYLAGGGAGKAAPRKNRK